MNSTPGNREFSENNLLPQGVKVVFVGPLDPSPVEQFRRQSMNNSDCIQ
ncbi:hypothetical protein HMPREF9374_1797 [Desmospora sp. 8437]|nr:hypothetical protein HMPREF9374_1797 [Desmospora sp. 8437]